MTCRLRWFTLVILASLVACLPQNKGGGGGGQSPATIDENCGARAVDVCASNQKCQVSGNQCVGTYAYCSSYSSESSCPQSSCQWSVSGRSCSPIVPYVPSPDQTGGQNQNPTCSQLTQTNCLPPSCSWNGFACVAAQSNTPTPTPSPTDPNSPTPPPGQPPTQNATCDAIGLRIVACANTPGCEFYFGLPPKLGCHAAGLTW
jgi:hypothetical protein